VSRRRPYARLVLQHVTIEVDPADLRRFEELLGLIGFSEVEAPAELGGAIPWYERRGTQVHLIPTEAATAPALGHAAFVAADFEADLARLREAGFEVERHRELWGEPRAFVAAPGGHRIELMAAPPPASS
jgi:catechol 2,3-dioxygenase-like lactoylglutathione lyase family enzyme